MVKEIIIINLIQKNQLVNLKQIIKNNKIKIPLTLPSIACGLWLQFMIRNDTIFE